MAYPPQLEIPATYMRGGTSKGVLFRLTDLPRSAQIPGSALDRLLLRVIGSPVPVIQGHVQETGDYELDGVTFPAAEVELELLCPVNADDAMFPTGNLVDDLEGPGIGRLQATLINAGIPTIFVDADAIGYTGTELQEAINGDAEALKMFETIRALGALRMGLIDQIEEATQRQHTPKVGFVSPAASYMASSGKRVDATRNAARTGPPHKIGRCRKATTVKKSVTPVTAARRYWDMRPA